MIQYDIISALPEIVLAVGAMMLMLCGVSHKTDVQGAAERSMETVYKGSILVILFAIIAIVYAQDSFVIFEGVAKSNGGAFFNDLFILDRFAVIVKAIILFSGGTVLALSYQYLKESAEKIGFEYPLLILLSLCGLMIMVSSNDLLTLYMGVELASLAMYVMASARRDDSKAAEAGMKYFILGALASGILLYGASLVYGFSGSTNFDLISASLSDQLEISKGLIIGLVLVVVGLAFKMSAAPFHMWTPDVYEGVPTPVTAYFAIVPKFAVAALFIRLLGGPFEAFIDQWQDLIVIIAIISMVVGGLGGIWQNNIKRLLAYSSIANMGYALVAIAAMGDEGVRAAIVFFTIYILTSIGIFAVILSVNTKSSDGEKGIEQIDHFKGFAKSNPILGMLFALMLISMIGLPFPPFAGFFGKFFVFFAAVDSGLYGLAVIGVVASVIASFYYLRIIKLMYFDDLAKNIKVDVNLQPHVKFIILFVTLVSLYIFINPAYLLEAARVAAESL